MKVYRFSKRVFKKIIYLLLMLLSICVCATYPEDVQPARVLIYGHGIYLYNIQNDGTLEVFAIENLTYEGMGSLEIDDFSDYSLVNSKIMSTKEIKVVNQLITDVKENSEPYKEPAVEDAALIVALIDEKHYYSTDYRSPLWGGDIAVQNLLHKLEEISESNKNTRGRFS